LFSSAWNNGGDKTRIANPEKEGDKMLTIGAADYHSWYKPDYEILETYDKPG